MNRPHLNTVDSQKLFDTFETLQQELTSALTLYWNIATRTLDNSGITVLPQKTDYLSIEKNFFSALFLYSYFRAGIPASRRVLYAASNQCLRGMVTGCDNILDNEYKKTLETDLPENATRFRSILDIMVSDRVLFALLQQGYREGGLTHLQVQAASIESLRTLVKSGAQEASEECGVGDILRPESILDHVHHNKTGILFQSPWALPQLLENQPLNDVAVIKKALFDIGMGCQIMDDMVDLPMDLKMNRHNYVVSLIWYGDNPEERSQLASRSLDGDLSLDDFPVAGAAAIAKALHFLKNGTGALFTENHRFMVDISISFFAKRIRADRFLSGI